MPGVGFLTRMSLAGAKRHQALVGIFPPRERRALLQPRYRSVVDETAWLLIEAHSRVDLEEIERRMRLRSSPS